MIRRFRLLLWLLVGLAAVLAAALWLRAERPLGTLTRVATMPADGAPVAIGAPFTLTASDGKRFASAQLAGTPYALFFGYTRCPDVCPTTMARMAKLRAELGKGDKSFAIVFVSVDPERDTPAEMARFASMFSTPIVALTGTPAEIAAVKRSFGIFSQKVPQPGGDYGVDHTATVLLFDRAGKFVATIAPDENDDVALAKVRRIAG